MKHDSGNYNSCCNAYSVIMVSSMFTSGKVYPFTALHKLKALSRQDRRRLVLVVPLRSPETQANES